MIIKTNRTDSSYRITAEEMNRISSNLNSVFGGFTLKTNYTSTDIITASQWHDFILSAMGVARANGLLIEDSADWDTFNKIEMATEIEESGHGRYVLSFSLDSEPTT